MGTTEMSILFQVQHLDLAMQCCSPLHVTTTLLPLETKKQYHPYPFTFPNYYCIGLQHTAGSPHMQCPHRRLVSLGNQARNLTNQAELPREAVPACGVWPGWMLAGSPEASLPESWPYTHSCVHTQTHLHRTQGTAWGGSHTRQHDVVVTGLSQCMGRAAGSPPLPWDWRCCGASQTAVFDA